MVVAYTELEVVAISPVAAAPCEDLHLSQNMHDRSSLEADHKLDNPYPHAQLSDKRCNIN